MSHRWPLWLALAMAVTVVACMCIILCQPIRNFDVWHQMAYGKQVVLEHTLRPDHHRYTWTPTSVTLIYCAWLSQAFFYLVHAALGVPGLILVRYLVHGAVLAMVLDTARRVRALSHPLTWLVALLTVFMSYAGHLVKPQIISLFFMGLTVYTWHRIRTSGPGGWKWCYAFPTIVLVWVNAHGAFVFVSPLLACIFAGALLNHHFSPSQALPPGVLRHLFMALILCLPALVVNPYGWDYLVFLVKSLSQGSTYQMQTVGEYKPTVDFAAAPYFTIDYMVAAGVALSLLLWSFLRRPRRIDWTIVLANAVYAWLYLQFFRTTFFWAPVFGMSAVSMLGDRGSGWWPSTPRARRILLWGLPCILLAMATRGVSGYLWSPAVEVGYGLSDATPVEEADYLDIHYRSRRLGNIYHQGGYLLWRLYPDTRILIDGRQYPFTDWYPEYMSFSIGENALFLKKFEANVWLVSHMKSALMEWFARSEQWRAVFFGTSGVVFAPVESVPPGHAMEIGDLSRMRSLLQLMHAQRSAASLGLLDLTERLVGIGTALPDRQGLYRMRAQLAMQLGLDGLHKYTRGQYIEAMALLSQVPGEGRSKIILGDCLYRVALEAWKQDKFIDALAIVRLARDAVSGRLSYLHNAAVLEWYAGENGITVDRFPLNEKVAITPDDKWRDELGLVVKAEILVPREQAWAVDQARAILAGTFEGRPRLLPPPNEPYLSN